AVPTRAPRWRFNSSLLRDETYKSQFETNLREFLGFNKGRRSEFLMHRTRQTYYFHSARPSHLLALRLRTNEHFADIFSVKSIDGTVLTDPKSVNTTFVSFYKDLDSENLNAPITHHEIEKAVMDMRKGRSPGPD
ncbi:hypothetical protein KUCAC02_019891, partial [Chaenocephalus aceratus]